jgi:hypothetical protein
MQELTDELILEAEHQAHLARRRGDSVQPKLVDYLVLWTGKSEQECLDAFWKFDKRASNSDLETTRGS